MNSDHVDVLFTDQGREALRDVTRGSRQCRIGRVMDLDIKTIQIVSFAINLTLGWFVWMQRRPPVKSAATAARLWSVGFAIIGVGSLLTACRDSLPPELSVVLGEALIVGGYALPIAGTRAFMSLTPQAWMFPLSVVISGAVSAYWSLCEPNPSLRITGLSLWGAVQCFWMAVSLRFWLPRRQAGLKSRKAVAVVASLFGIFLCFYAFRILTGEPLQTLPYQTDGGVVATVACAALLSIFFALWCMSILSGRLGRTLRQEVERRDKMLTVLAHDLRGPFNILLGGTEAMATLARKGQPDKVLEMAEDVHQASRQAYALTDGLLIWAKSQFSGEPATSVDLDDAVTAACASLRQTFRAKRVTLTQSNYQDIQVLANRGGLETIIRNLLSNAAKFSDPDTEVHISTATHAGEAVLTVADQGIGMTSLDLERVLDAGQFHSTPGTAGESGTGLGLSFCRDIARSFGGSLEIDSAFGQGTRVVVRLQLAAPDAERQDIVC